MLLPSDASPWNGIFGWVKGQNTINVMVHLEFKLIIMSQFNTLTIAALRFQTHQTKEKKREIRGREMEKEEEEKIMRRSVKLPHWHSTILNIKRCYTSQIQDGHVVLNIKSLFLTTTTHTTVSHWNTREKNWMKDISSWVIDERKCRLCFSHPTNLASRELEYLNSSNPQLWTRLPNSSNFQKFLLI